MSLVLPIDDVHLSPKDIVTINALLLTRYSKADIEHMSRDECRALADRLIEVYSRHSVPQMTEIGALADDMVGKVFLAMTERFGAVDP